VCEPVEEPPRDARRDHRVAGRQDADRLEELLRWHVLEQEPAGPGAQAGVHVLVEIEGREDQHARRIGPAADAIGGGDAVEPRHAHVHEHDVDGAPFDEGDGLLAVARLAHDLHVGLCLEHHPEPHPEHGLVVDERDADRHPTTPTNGNDATTS
jgi:hypothetical protein